MTLVFDTSAMSNTDKLQIWYEDPNYAPLTVSDFDAKIGLTTETAPATDVAASGLNGRLQRIAQRISSLITALGSPFQAGGSIGNSIFGSTQSGTWTVQPGNTANTTAWKVDNSAVTQPVSAVSLPLPSGAATELTLDTRTGALTETAPATDTASSGINGRLQRIAQRITSLITALGSPFQAGGSIGNSSFGATQSGTWTVQPGNTANTTAWKTDGSAVTQPVSVASLPLPSGVATESTLDTRTGSLTETAPATDTASSGINGRLQRIAQRITSLITALGSPFQAGGSIGNSSFASTQSGTWTVQPGNTANTTAWKVDASSVAVPITDNSGSITVDNAGTFAVQSTIAAAATNIAKAEDVASADADVGVPAMMVRKATPANTSGTDGDYEMLQGSAGRLWVDASGKTLTVDGSGVTQPVSIASVPSHAVTNAGTFAVQATVAAGATNIAKAEDVASADADVGVPAMAIQKATPADTAGTDGDYAMLQMSAGRMWSTSNIDKVGGTAIDTNSGNKSAGTVRVVIATDQPQNTTALKVDNSAVTQPVSGTVTTNETVPTTIYNGKKTVTTAGTRVTLAASQAVKTVTIKALAANTGTIFVGDGSVASTTGFALAAGDTVSFDIANLNTVNLDASVNGEGVTYLGVN